MPVKKKTTEDAILSPKAQGVANFLEFTRSSGIQQVIVVSESEVEGTYRPPVLMMRQISAESRRRPWDVRMAPKSEGKTSVERAADYLAFYSRFLAPSLSTGSWERKGNPVGVETTAADVVEIEKGKAPQAMIGRIAAISKLLEEGETETVTVAAEGHHKTVVAAVKAADKSGEQTEFFYDTAKVPAEIAATIFGSFGFNSDIDFQKSAASYIHERGRISVRASAKVPVDQSALDALSGGDEWYARPTGEKYYTRKWGEHDDVLVMRKGQEAGAFIFLRSAPGTGKTALTEAAFGEDMYTLIGTGDTEVADLVGGYVQMPDGTFAWHHGPLVKALTEGKPFFIDEIGLIDPKVLAVVYGIMDGRKTLDVPANPSLGTLTVQPGFYVVAATNPKAPGVRLSEALLSRFTIHVEMTTDWGLARKLGVPDEIVTVAKNLANAVEKGEITWAPQMRELLGYRDNARTFGEAFAIANLLALAPESDRPVVADKFSRGIGSTVHPAKIAN